MGDSTAESLIGRDHIVRLVATLVERPRSVDRPLPIVVLAGPGGIGKSHLLDHLERASRPELPCVRVNLDQDPNATSCRVVLDVIYEQLRGYEHPQFGRFRLRRYELGRWMQSEALRDGADPAEDAEKSRDQVLARFVTRLRRRWKVLSDGGAAVVGTVPSRALRIAVGWLLRMLVPASLVLRRGTLRRILWGRHDDAAMRWYESQATRMRLPARIDRMAEWFGRRAGGHAGEDDRTAVDELLLDALLADLRSCYLHRVHRRYRTAYCQVLIDDADLLPAAPHQNFLTLLAHRRRFRQWDPLLVVATKQAGLGEEVDGAPQGWFTARPVEPAAVHGHAGPYEEWLERYARQDRDPNPYLPLRLRRLTPEQTRLLVTDLVSLPTVDDSGLVLAEEMYRVSHGHPLAVSLLTEALRTEHARWPARELPSARSRLDHPIVNRPPDAPHEETIESYLLWRMLQRVAAPEEYTRLTDELILCGAARRLDVDIVQMLITSADPVGLVSHSRARRWLDRVAGYSFVESIEDDAVTFHPLLRDLLARQLVATGTDETSPYHLVHRRLRDHFEERSRAGDEVALCEYLYHSLALGDVRPMLDRLLPVLAVRTNAATKDRWLRLLLSVTEAPMPTQLAVSSTDARPMLRNLIDWITDRLHGDDGRLVEAIFCTWLIRSNTSWVRLDEPLLDRAIRAFRALPGVDRDSLVRDQLRYLENLHRYATGQREREPLPGRTEFSAPTYQIRLRRTLPSRQARRNTATAAVLVPVLALSGWVAVRYADYRDSVCAPVGVRSALSYGGEDDGRTIQRLSDGQCVGITDGSFTFSRFAEPYERKILEQNRDVEHRAAEGQPVVTVVVTAMLTSDDRVSPQKDIGSGVNELKGAYLAQWRYNTGGDPTLTRTPNPLLRVLIANVGGKSRQADLVARKILDLSTREPLVAVTGLAQTREETRRAVRTLGAAGIPMVASVVSGDQFRGLEHFFRVAASNDREAAALVTFAASRFRRRPVFLLRDQRDQYSSDLAADLSRHLRTAGVSYRDLDYTAESDETGNQIRFATEQACRRTDPLILYTGRANELGTLFSALTDLLCTDAVVLGGDEASSLQAPPNEGFPVTAADRLYFTSFGPDETTWRRLHGADATPPFYTDHSRFFRNDEVNGHVVAAYDATEAVTQAIRAAKSSAHGGAVNAGAVYRALTEMHGDTPHHGVSGLIDFGPDGEPRNKLVLIQKVVAAHEVSYVTDIGSR